MSLTLLAGPANAGKVERLLRRYGEELEREPLLIVPNRSDVDRVERDLLRETGALLGGSIGTFDDLFRELAREGSERRRSLTPAQRALVLRKAVAATELEGLAPSARSTGFAEALGGAISELEAGLAEPDDVEGELARLYSAYRDELERLGVWDSELERRYAAERIAGDLGAWDGRPVLAYGFEDLTGTQWLLLEALAARADVTVSLPYEPGRPAFESLSRTASDLAALAGDRIEELPPGSHRYVQPALAHLERSLFSARSDDLPAAVPPPLEGAVRFLEAAGGRGLAELVAKEIVELLRGGVSAEEIAVVCPSLEGWRATLETAFGEYEVPVAFEGALRLPQTPYGQALLGLLRFAWLGGARRELFAFLRSPYSGLPRHHVDFLEGRLRGRAIRDERVEEETLKHRGKPLPMLEAMRGADPVAAVRELSGRMLTAAYGLESPPVGEGVRLELRAHEETLKLLKELGGLAELTGDPVSREDVVAGLERASIWLSSRNAPGRVVVLDPLRARTRRFEHVFVLGLEHGNLPRRERPSPFLDDDARRELEQGSRRVRLRTHDPIARERYLFYTVCTRASRRLYLAREAANDEGTPREASPFWDEVRSLFDREDVERWTKRRPLSALTWPLDRAPTERERLRAVASLAADDEEAAFAVARAYGWSRRLERAHGAWERPTKIGHPRLLEELAARTSFSVTELEAYADCSSIWFIDRVVSPRSIDAEVDPRLRGSVAHQALYKCFSGLPKRFGVDRLEPAQVAEAGPFLRECLQEALGGLRLDLTDLQRRELEHGLWLDLQRFVRQEAELALPLVPRRFEVSFGSERSAPELQRGLQLGDFTLSGKIDRVDVDPFSARGIIQDYKSGRTVFTAAKIDSELRLQIPLYVAVLRDLLGFEPLGGLYRALGGEQSARGLLRREAKDDGIPGFATRDYLAEDEFWGQVERAQEHAVAFVGRIRSGDVRHDPRGSAGCHSWCELAPMCRVERQ